MSKASMAQEPSMDEILASIRRIIETGEDRNGAPVARSPFRDMAPRSIPALVPAEPVPSMPPADDAEPASAAVEPVSDALPVADDDHLTAQLETELAASWGEIGTSAPLEDLDREPRDDAPPAEPQTEAVMTTGSQTGWAPFAASVTSDTEQFERSEERDTASFAPVNAAPEPATAALDEGAASPAFLPANTDRPAAVGDFAPQTRSYEYREASEALLSERSGTLVASSFEELAQAIRNGELRSIEAMAQDMLRPMLREWLDDNLPHMVERLVREEIDRMARGGRR